MAEEEVIDSKPWERLIELLPGNDAAAVESYVESLPMAEAVRAVSRLSEEDRIKAMDVLSPELASSIIGTVQILAGALSSTVAASGLLGDSYVSLCLIMAASAILAFVLALSSFRSVGRRSCVWK